MTYSSLAFYPRPCRLVYALSNINMPPSASSPCVIAHIKQLLLKSIGVSTLSHKAVGARHTCAGACPMPVTFNQYNIQIRLHRHTTKPLSRTTYIVLYCH